MSMKYAKKIVKLARGSSRSTLDSSRTIDSCKDKRIFKLGKLSSRSTLDTSDTLDTSNSSQDIYNADEMISHLQQTICDLESEIETEMKEARARENMLLDQIYTMEQKIEKLEVDIEKIRSKSHKVNQKLYRSQLDRRREQTYFEMSASQSQQAKNTLCKLIVADRKWLETEMTRRFSNRDPMKREGINMKRTNLLRS